ncbi:hypothetical protein EVAR_75671_1 [Eumeta japonica]|uniref:Uncharacterized protein n=1 Tax=Eumeta variegata TaxID=151549 RepID=A0A4C1U086_EUMVA|nr:hypothetical protein EVAR_75671_1 [Eumeta japonica]
MNTPVSPRGEPVDSLKELVNGAQASQVVIGVQVQRVHQFRCNLKMAHLPAHMSCLHFIPGDVTVHFAYFTYKPRRRVFHKRFRLQISRELMSTWQSLVLRRQTVERHYRALVCTSEQALRLCLEDVLNGLHPQIPGDYVVLDTPVGLRDHP